MFISDTHCDTLTEIYNKNLSLYENNLHMDIKRLKRYDGFSQVFACFIAPKFRKGAKQYAKDAFSNFKNEVLKNSEYIGIATDFFEYKRLLEDNKIAAFLSIEGGEAIEQAEDVAEFFGIGVRIVTLTWNHDNKIASGVLGTRERGVTEFGKKVIRKMGESGMVVDVSHLNEKSFWDAAELSCLPIVATHSDAYSLCKNPRNLTDEQFLEIVRQGGYVGVNLYPDFLRENGHAKISDILEHIEYFLALGGEDIIGLGCDFDGVDSLPEGIFDVRDIEKIFNEMAKIGYSSELMDKIAHKNFEKIIKLF